MSNVVAFPATTPPLPDYDHHQGRTIAWEPWTVAPTVTTEGLPESLCTALTDWADARSTPHQEVAEFVGWPVERVQAARDDL